MNRLAPGVSIIIPVYNVTAYLGEALDSLAMQGDAALEVIVVDDGSSSEARAAIEAHCAKRPDVRLLHQPHRGQAMARQHGVQQSQGEYVLFLDADDMLLPGAVPHLLQALAEAPRAVAAYGRTITVDAHGGFAGPRAFPSHEQALSGDLLPALLQGRQLLSNGAICMRRTALGRLMFLEGLPQGEDWVLWCRLALCGEIQYAGKRPVLAIRRHGNNVSRQVFSAPRLFAPMLDAVYDDPAFAARVGAAQLARYRHAHRLRIHHYLRHGYRTQGQWLRAAWQAFCAWRLGPAYFVLPERRPGTICVLHVVRRFYAGGAERLLSSLLEHSDPSRFTHMVLSLSDRQERLQNVEARLGIPYTSVEMKRGVAALPGFIHALRIIRRARPDMLKTWLPAPNIHGGMMGRLLGIPVVWGIHDAQPVSWRTPHTRQQRLWSRLLPSRIVCCSQPVYDTCRSAGYDTSLLHIIPNGTDTRHFDFRPDGRKRLRDALGIGEDVLLIGMAAEYVPLKRHHHVLLAAKQWLAEHPNTRFLLCGKDTGPDNPHLAWLLRLLELEPYVHALGIRDDMADIYSALDIHTLASTHESFGLSVTEAMACKTLCVATDVGIMPSLLQEVGVVFPVSAETRGLLDAWRTCLQWTEAERGQRQVRGRQRIERHYSVTQAAQGYDALFEALAGDKKRTG